MDEGVGSGVTDGPVTCATTQISTELFVELGAGLEIFSIVAFKQRHNEAGRAITALRPEILYHRLLHRMGFLRADTFDCDDIAACHERKGDQTAVNRAITSLAVGVTVDDRNRASSAVAFRAAFFRTRQAASSQPFQ